MTDVESLLDELDGRLTAVAVNYPDSRLFILSLQKHIQHALENQKEVRLEKLLKKSREWLHEMSWKHPLFRPDFMKMVELIDKFKEQRG